MSDGQKHIFLTVRELVQWSPGPGQSLPGFPLHWRGIWGHQTQTRIHQLRPEWQNEFPVEADIKVGPVIFTISGKIDLLWDNDDEVFIEEIKTVILTRSAFNRMQIEAYPHFVEQLLIYGYLYHISKPDKLIRLRLTIVNLINQQERPFELTFNTREIKNLILSRLKLKINELTFKRNRTRSKIRLAKKIVFDPETDRPFQREMIDTIAGGLEGSQAVLISAPTGSGKTIAALFPVIRFALENNKRIFFATAKNTQHDAVAHNLQLLLGTDFPLTTLFLRAREKMCANTIYFCHVDYCPYINDFYSRLKNCGVTERLLRSYSIFPEEVYRSSADQRLCPAEVQWNLARQADLIVGDYNYIFDPIVSLQSLLSAKPAAEWILIIDEAHNLYARALQLLSPSLEGNELDILEDIVLSKTARVYRRLSTSIKKIRQIIHQMYADAAAFTPNQQAVLAEPDNQLWLEAFQDFEQSYLNYLLHRIRYRQIPEDDPIMEFYHRFRVYIQILQFENPAFTPFLSAGKGGSLTIQCCDPSEFLRERHRSFHSVIAMSATLDPMNYYARILGFDMNDTRFLRLSYPFQTARRKIVLVPEFDTRLDQRHQYYPKYAEIIKNVVSLKTGNYIVFFPSFEFLQATNLYLGTLELHKLFQRPMMEEAERNEILRSLREKNPPKILLAVTGGIFSEGIDLPGESCIGVIIFGPSLPVVSPDRELIRRYYDQKGGDGFMYAYIYPGMTRVIQAAGRLIRSEQDYGILVLVGDRLADDRFAGLFPEYWGDLTITRDYQSPLIEFWREFRT